MTFSEMAAKSMWVARDKEFVLMWYGVQNPPPKAPKRWQFWRRASYRRDYAAWEKAALASGGYV